jgi:SAM-dependent methyltransferase
VRDAARPEQVNERVWSRGRFVRAYAGRALRPAEVLLLVRYREALSGRVLELGCGAGRVTGYLIELAREVHAIDLSPAMVDYCRRRYPGATYAVGDLRDLSAFDDGSLDVVFAGANVLDVLGDEERRRVLGEVRRVLAPDGLLVMSTHNRAYIPSIRLPPRLRPAPSRLRQARQLAAMPVFLYNHRRLRSLQRSEERYAIVNDDAHRYTLLHYYVTRDDQERQFDETGFELLECLDEDARRVPPGAAAAESGELYYAARRRHEAVPGPRDRVAAVS